MNTAAEHHPILWIIVLVATIVASVVATVVDNVVKGDADRCHNPVLLFNECLAEHYSAYFVFFMALATSTAFTQIWGTGLLLILFLTVVALYVKGVHSTTKHSKKIARDHACVVGECAARLRWTTIIRICGMNLIFAIFMFGAACYLSAITLRNPAQ